jgi:hypothetical protein
MVQPNNLPKELVMFLKGHGALKQYRANVAELCDDYITELPPAKTSWLDMVFTWGDTPQGSDYWDDLDTEWDKHLDNTEEDYND